MEYLEGDSLARAIAAEQTQIAHALGLADADALRDRMVKHLRRHFEAGGGAGSHLPSGAGSAAGGRPGGQGVGPSGAQMRLAMAAAPLLRVYASARQRLLSLSVSVYNVAADGIALLSLGRLQPARRKPPVSATVDLSQVLRVLIQVHGTQMLLDGVYNADPHPGNVVVLEDGRLGLIDYGMVGRLSKAERATLAKVVLALGKGELGKREVYDLYHSDGYRAGWHSGKRIGQPHGVSAVHRFATFHLDRIDLSPVQVDDLPGSAAPSGAAQQAAQTMPVIKVLQSTIEQSVPDWVEQGRRLGGLLIGVGSQTARPISLASEWAPIAREALTVN